MTHCVLVMCTILGGLSAVGLICKIATAVHADAAVSSSLELLFINAFI